MQPMLSYLSALIAVIITFGDWQTEAASRDRSVDEAISWLQSHSRQGPVGIDELADLKGANPEAYAIVQALLTKKAMGLIKAPDHLTSIPVAATPEIADQSPNVSRLLDGLRPPTEPVGLTPSVVAQGAPGLTLDMSGPDDRLAEVWKERNYDGPPPIPPPPPISGPLPPELPDLNMTSNIIATHSITSYDAPTLVGAVPNFSLPIPAYKPIGLSATAVTLDRSSSSSRHNWLNWRPDQMIADNERMVQSVLGAVAQLTGGRTPRAPSSSTSSSAAISREHDALSMPASEDIRQASPRQARTEIPSAILEPAPRTQDAASNVLQSMSALPIPAAPKISVPAKTTAAADHQKTPEAPNLEDALETPSSVNWKNPYTFTANTNSQAKPAQQENQFLKGIDLGVPTVTLPPRRSSDDDNPYLQGLNLAGTPAPTLGADLKPEALSAMHQSQLLTSHKLLSSFDWGESGQRQITPRPARQEATSEKRPQPSLHSWLTSGKKQTSLAPKSTHVARERPSPSDDQNDQNNPYMQVFGLNTRSDDQQQQQEEAAESPPSLRGASTPGKADPRFPLASFKWDDDDSKAPSSSQKQPIPQKQLSMASSASTVHEKEDSRKKSNKNTLKGWLTVESTPNAPDIKAQKLQETIDQKVADDKNPYLKGLDLERAAPPSDSGQNSYLNSLS